MVNNSLSPRLRLFVQIEQTRRSSYLGYRLPISIRKAYKYSQCIVIYPESDYDFFIHSEVERISGIAKALNLSLSIHAENGVPVIEVEEYFEAV